MNLFYLIMTNAQNIIINRVISLAWFQSHSFLGLASVLCELLGAKTSRKPRSELDSLMRYVFLRDTVHSPRESMGLEQPSTNRSIKGKQSEKQGAPLCQTYLCAECTFVQSVPLWRTYLCVAIESKVDLHT